MSNIFKHNPLPWWFIEKILSREECEVNNRERTRRRTIKFHISGKEDLWFLLILHHHISSYHQMQQESFSKALDIWAFRNYDCNETLLNVAPYKFARAHQFKLNPRSTHCKKIYVPQYFMNNFYLLSVELRETCLSLL